MSKQVPRPAARSTAARWSGADGARCRAHPDLVAVYESPLGRFALLTRHTLWPLAAERETWLRDVRRTAAAVIAQVLGDPPTPVVVLQLRSLREVLYVGRWWFCRYCGDEARRKRLIEIAERQLRDLRYIVARSGARRSPAEGARAGATTLEQRVTQWYEAMIPTWLALAPPLRRHLVLCVHRWLADQVFPTSDCASQRLGDLTPGGPLAEQLAGLVPAMDGTLWTPWIERALVDLHRALTWPPALRTETWYRRAFLIPYQIPAPASSERGELAELP